jgi:hypothetical protein
VRTSFDFRRALVGMAFLVLAPLAGAQNAPTKQPPRLPPNVSQTSQIPAGTDTGTPTTSNNVPLGMPNPTDATVDRLDQQTHSAAARAAARPDPLTRSGAPLSPAAPLVGNAVIRDASRPAGTMSQGASAERLSCAYNDDPTFRNSMSQCTGMADRSARSSCVDRVMQARRETNAPVALPNSGFVGSSASPSEAASLDRNASRRGCV